MLPSSAFARIVSPTFSGHLYLKVTKILYFFHLSKDRSVWGLKSIHSAPLMRKTGTWDEGGLFRAQIAIITILDSPV